jgi:acetyl-CoA carboxylase biotin carboxyl carrier protein
MAASELAGAIKAPMVGTAYLQPQPDAAPFIKIGDTVREGQTLLIIEAMKVMNQIPSPRGGRVAQILVEDGAPIEYGQPLVVLE